MTLFTPGPWTWNEKDRLVGGSGETIIETDMGHYPPRGADRALLAAAPELLAALQDVKARAVLDNVMLKVIDAAIAKATS